MAVSTPQTTAADPVSNNPTAHNDTNQQSTPNTPTAATSSPRVEQRSGSSAGMELKPIGIHNESNTCFLNSTFQALSATAPLTTLLSSSPQSPLSIHANSSLPDPTVHPKLIPSLHPDILEPPLYELLPVTRAFTNSLHRAWRMKEAGGGTYGHGETSSKRSMSLNSLLREIARKYDQYDDYSQQDAHELLRHLLDSMEMEEKDVIKKLQPSNNSHGYGYGNNKRKKSKSNLNSLKSGQTTPSASNTMNSHQQHLMDIKHISPLPSPLPSPANTRPPSPGHRDVDPMAHAVPININGQMTGHAVHEEPIFSPSDTPVESGSEIVQLIPDEERLIPFVDVLFGGSLASVVVCEKCKAVSHTYEGFLDISLSLKGDDPKPRKRDRLRAMARKFRPRKSNTTSSEAQPHSVVSESELSETEGPTEKGRRKSMDSDDRITIDSNNTNSSGLGRSSSTISFGGLKSKPSFSFRRKDKKAASPVIAPSPTFEEDHIKSPATSVPNSPSLYGQGGHGDRKHKHHHKHHGPGPTPAQAAYISRILAPPPGTVDLDDPLAKLRAAQSGQPIEVSPSTSSEYGLIDALRAFTSVEVLEGENAFACKKCWKIKHGYYAKHEATVKEEDEEQLKDEEGFPQTYTRDSVSTASSVGNSPLLMPNARMGSQSHQAPQISVMGSPSSEKSSNSSYWDNDGRLGRSQKNSNNPTIRAPSPLRRQLELEEQEKLNSQMASATLSSTYGSDYSGMTMDSVTKPEEEDEEEESDGLSDSDTSIDENHHNGPNEDTNLDDGKKKKKKKSKKDKDANKRSHHVVMGRAFKRYLIAKKPEILVFHFKRFKQTAKSYSFSSFYDLKKIDDFVSFPETLDLAPFLAPNRQDYKVNQTPSGPRATYMEWANPEQGPELEPVMYRLYAVVVHLGTMIGGHYIAYCLIDPEQMFGPSAEGEGAENKTPVVEPTDQRSIKSQQSGAAGSGKNKKDRRVWCFCSE
uniref:USP domain-containing protein n=1 Tax=Kwoniella bestiolae CBS 10118 TaxID=1296100 RepID=A0A1B9FR50_9TREE|nr:hypothetical protein I302_08913 [Kwoniella bestiolae CBS 10118]OCF21241.1 hypothetical protein I302_08913 [Kwoniella bestiolae CBS 10118]